eukprot:9082545-Ditylum_brightwellii.AAC.1
MAKTRSTLPPDNDKPKKSHISTMKPINPTNKLEPTPLVIPVMLSTTLLNKDTVKITINDSKILEFQTPITKDSSFIDTPSTTIATNQPEDSKKSKRC